MYTRLPFLFKHSITILLHTFRQKKKAIFDEGKVAIAIISTDLSCHMNRRFQHTGTLCIQKINRSTGGTYSLHKEYIVQTVFHNKTQSRIGYCFTVSQRGKHVGHVMYKEPNKKKSKASKIGNGRELTFPDGNLLRKSCALLL